MEVRVFLRALEPEDFKTSVNWRNDKEISEMIVGPKYFVSSETEKNWVLNNIQNTVDKMVLAICLKDTNEYIGNVYLTHVDWINKSGQTHILIGEKKFWGMGYGTEAELLILRFAFCERGLQRISARVLESNIASIKMHEKCGYVKEGLLRKAVYKNGEFQNLVVLSILKEEFDSMMQKDFVKNLFSNE